MKKRPPSVEGRPRMLPRGLRHPPAVRVIRATARNEEVRTFVFRAYGCRVALRLSRRDVFQLFRLFHEAGPMVPEVPSRLLGQGLVELELAELILPSGNPVRAYALHATDVAEGLVPPLFAFLEREGRRANPRRRPPVGVAGPGGRG